jgi:hypothetical protein
VSIEWKGLPRPECIDKVSHIWTMTIEEKLALDELMSAEVHGRMRMSRYQQWICDVTGIPRWVALHIVVEYPPRNS